MTYAEVLARNVRTARRRKELDQEPLAARMRTLGHSAWRRQTVANVEKAARRVTAEEVLGLALALETSITALMSPPREEEAGAVRLSSGDLLPASEVAILARGLLHRRAIVWEDDKPVFRPPPSTSVMHAFTEVLMALQRAEEGGFEVTQRHDGSTVIVLARERSPQDENGGER